jgi:glycosyltransferase involved in cell wall biosynthesis
LQRIVSPFSSSGGLPEWWEPLLRVAGNASIFLTAAWMQTWLETYGVNFRGLWVHWEMDAQVVGGCLLLERTDWRRGIPLRTVYFNATGESSRPSPYAEFNDVVHVPAHANAIASDLCRLVSTRRWSRLQLSGYEPGGVFARLVEMLPHAAVERETEAARYVDLRGIGERAFETTLTGKSGTYVRRNHRWYSDHRGTIEVRRAGDADEAKQMFADLRGLHIARFAARGESTSLADDAVVAFHNRLIERLWPSGQVEFLRVGTAESAIGFLYNYVIDAKVFVFQTGFAYESGSKWSPGLLTHASAIENYRGRGIHEYDFLSGEALYKRTLANRSRELCWSTVYRDRLPLVAILGARRVFKGLVGRAPRTAVTLPPALPPVGVAPAARLGQRTQLNRHQDGTPADVDLPAAAALAAPLVSVVIAAYNSDATLPATLDSVLAQSYPNVEVVVVDDGSTDRTADVLAEYRNEVRVIRKPNGGLASARNAGCEAAHGEFIALLDADDLCVAERIAMQVSLMLRHPEVTLCSSEFSSFDESGMLAERDAANYYSRLGRARGQLASLYGGSGPVDLTPWPAGAESGTPAARAFIGTIYPALALGSFIHPPTVMFRREVWTHVGRFDESIRNGCDWEWLVRVARSSKVGYIDHPLLNYRRSANQLSGHKHKLQVYRDGLSNLERFLRADPTLAGAAMRRSIGEAHINVAEALVETDRLGALAHLGSAAACGTISASWLTTLAVALLPRWVLAHARAARGT